VVSRTGASRVAAGALAVLAVLAGVLVAGPVPSARADVGDSIERYHVVLEVRPDGRLVVTETIAYDFGANLRRGILRDIPTRQRYDDRHDRVYPVEGVAVTAQPPSTG